MLEIIIAFTSHFIDGDFNEIHPGLRYEHTPYVASLYKNSEGNPSVFVGLVGRDGPLFAEIGLATGYRYAVVPIGRVGIETERFRFFAFPAVTDNDVGLGLGFEMRF